MGRLGGEGGICKRGTVEVAGGREEAQAGEGVGRSFVPGQDAQAFGLKSRSQEGGQLVGRGGRGRPCAEHDGADTPLAPDLEFEALPLGFDDFRGTRFEGGAGFGLAQGDRGVHFALRGACPGIGVEGHDPGRLGKGARRAKEAASRDAEAGVGAPVLGTHGDAVGEGRRQK